MPKNEALDLLRELWALSETPMPRRPEFQEGDTEIKATARLMRAQADYLEHEENVKTRVKEYLEKLNEGKSS